MVPELVELVRPKPRTRLRGRDFSRTSHRAPTTVKRLTQAYNEPARTSPWRNWPWAVGALVVLGLAAVLGSPLFRLKNIIIDGAPSPATEARLRALIESTVAGRRLGIFPQSNLIFLSTERLAGALGSEVADVTVRFDRHWPNVLRVTLPPNVFVATWQVGEQAYLLDQRGTLAQILTEPSANLPLTRVHELAAPSRTIGDQVGTSDLALFLQHFATAWATALPNIPLDYLEVDQANLPTVRAVPPGGWYVMFSSSNELNAQLATLKRLLEEKLKDDVAKLEYIDVRFGSKLYYKLRP